MKKFQIIYTFSPLSRQELPAPKLYDFPLSEADFFLGFQSRLNYLNPLPLSFSLYLWLLFRSARKKITSLSRAHYTIYKLRVACIPFHSTITKERTTKHLHDLWEYPETGKQKKKRESEREGKIRKARKGLKEKNHKIHKILPRNTKITRNPKEKLGPISKIKKKESDV